MKLISKLSVDVNQDGQHLALKQERVYTNNGKDTFLLNDSDSYCVVVGEIAITLVFDWQPRQR